MKVIIAGSRSITDIEEVASAIYSMLIEKRLLSIDEVVSGGAKGVDELGERWAADTGLDCKVFPANWDKHGRSAGILRNIEMADYADALIAIWDGKSKGTSHMILEMHKRNKLVFVRTVKR